MDKLEELKSISKAVLARCKPDELFFALCARDPLAPDLVREWAERYGGADFEKLKSAEDLADFMELQRPDIADMPDAPPVDAPAISASDLAERIERAIALQGEKSRRASGEESRTALAISRAFRSLLALADGGVSTDPPAETQEEFLEALDEQAALRAGDHLHADEG
jgi:hypothetical protein